MSITFEIELGVGLYWIWVFLTSAWMVIIVIHRWLLCLTDLVYKYHMIYNLILYDICYFIQKSLKMKIHVLHSCIYYIQASRNFRGDLFLAFYMICNQFWCRIIILVLLKCILCFRLWGYCRYLIKISTYRVIYDYVIMVPYQD